MNKEELWINYLVGNGITREDSEADKIRKLDRLLDKFWNEEKME